VVLNFANESERRGPTFANCSTWNYFWSMNKDCVRQLFHVEQSSPIT
jgi:hypothetical protein